MGVIRALMLVWPARDAQVVNEVATLQRHIVLRLGAPAVDLLSARLLPAVGLSAAMVQVCAPPEHSGARRWRTH
jgi:hypothetical protein